MLLWLSGASQEAAIMGFLRQLKNRSNLPWVMIWDFNDIASPYEKKGAIPHPDGLIRGFNDMLSDCELSDLGMVGYQFTWERGRGTDRWVEERLDRAVGTLDWCVAFNEATVHNIHTLSSDHSAICLDPEARLVNRVRRHFKFEAAWLLDEDCRKVVEQSWGFSSGLAFERKISNCGKDLWRWGGDYFSKFGRKIQKLRGILEQLRGSRRDEDVFRYHQVEGELRRLLAQEEIFWRQRSKQLWLKEGDLNTKYFHRFASTRRKFNQLLRIQDHAGTWVDGAEMNEEVLRYYTDIFKAGMCDANLFNTVQSRVTTECNVRLLRPIEHDEVKAALFSMAPDKAPGPDGMTPSFYQNFWSTVGRDLIDFVKSCFENCSLPPGLNDTNVVLTPKKKVPEKVSNLRLIALCNVSYKVLAKVVANRMKVVLDSIISPSQSAFVPDRLISDNIIVAGEIGHYLRRKREGSVGWAALKLDMTKAYDRMEWSFLEGMLLALGFARGWVDLVLLCVTSVRYNIMVNGGEVGTVIPSRGIQQGDPLSPSLFIVCAEGLSLLLQQKEAQGQIHGVKVARGAPPVSHLFFADDSLLFFKSIDAEAQEVRNCLLLYSRASGQVVNFEKSSIMFSTNTRSDMRDHVASVFHVQQVQDFGRYLGLPSFLGRNRTTVFRYVEQRVRERVNSWQKKLLTRAGKEVLLKSVAQAMPIFSMSVFLLPIGVCHTIENIMNRFWWQHGRAVNRGIHWMSWSRMSIPKQYGGIGFKRLHEFNVALLAKQGWRLLTSPYSLMSRVLKARYFPNDCFLSAKLGSNPSYIWRSILAGQNLLREGVLRRVGDGKDTIVWGWPWLADSVDSALQTGCIEELKEAKVCNLMTANGDWDDEVVRDLFSSYDVPRILSTPISPNHHDTWCWKGDVRGQYMVRHGYHLLMHNFLVQDSNVLFSDWGRLWNLPVPPKVKNFLWRCVRNILPVRDVLQSKRVWIGGGCPFCPFDTETVTHLLCDCSIARQVWGCNDVLLGRSFVEFVESTLRQACVEDSVNMVARFLVIWLVRNDLIWHGKVWTLEAMHNYINALLVTWRDLQATPPTTQHMDANPVTWSPPPLGMISCNVDAVLHEGTVTYGAILRDHQGVFVAAHSGQLMCGKDPYLAEAMAVKEALAWIKSRSGVGYLVESDCLNFFNSYNSGRQDYSHVGLVIQQCRIIACDIGNTVVRHVRRSANHVAHVLARAAGSSSVLGEWVSSPPDCISGLF
ncbi:uncharacterized protein LOC116033057 [Ipomoea triloba]|uniref:uncharacterized protein LOC116033057 n=1 Tax=Ipomoea triloba TaxID=35885 RepID=UPI00125E3E91|nr:uncharacterized protein LOC116033057 [Ipomoea triloba]